MAVEEGLDPLGRVGLDEAGIRVRQIETEEVDLLQDTTDHRYRLAEVDLGMAGRVGERDEHLLGPGMPLADVILHGRVATGEAVLGTQALKDPLGRVPLLRRCARSAAKIASMIAVNASSFGREGGLVRR